MPGAYPRSKRCGAEYKTARAFGARTILPMVRISKIIVLKHPQTDVELKIEFLVKAKNAKIHVHKIMKPLLMYYPIFNETAPATGCQGGYNIIITIITIIVNVNGSFDKLEAHPRFARQSQTADRLLLLLY